MSDYDDLRKQLEEESSLLFEYETKLRHTDDPRKIGHYKWEISRIEEKIEQIKSKQEQALQREKSPVKKKIPFILPIEDRETFTGRETELNLLKDLLLSKNKTRKVCSIAGVAGIGGIGKSALACHFATKYREQFPDGIIGIRVDGKDNETIARDFARKVGIKIDTEDERDACTIMEDVFASRRMLLIFDNANTKNKNLKGLIS